MLFKLCSLVIIGIVIAFIMEMLKRFELIMVSGSSMFPTLVDRQIVLMRKDVTEYKVGDICVAYQPQDMKLVIKRIALVDVISGDDVVWLLGDNRANSMDSRVYGWVSMANLEGRVIKVYGNRRKRNQRD